MQIIVVGKSEILPGIGAPCVGFSLGFPSYGRKSQMPLQNQRVFPRGHWDSPGGGRAWIPGGPWPQELGGKHACMYRGNL